MYHIGHKIRYFRIKNGMTQAELASDIISFSYLSKIENGIIKPSSEIIRLLCNKLNISPNLLDSDFQSDFKICKKWFKSLLVGDKEKALGYYWGIIGTSSIYTHNGLINLIELNKLRFFLLTNQREKINRQVRVLERKWNEFNDIEKYYYYKFKGEYYISQSQYEKALKSFKNAEELISKDLLFKEEEENDLFYLIAITASKMYQVYTSIIYVSKALTFYQSTYNLLKSGNCHILLGISYRRINDIESSHRSYQMAKTIGEKLNNPKLIALANQNIGALFSSKEESQTAISYFHQSYKMRKGQEDIDLLIPISSLVKEYYKLNDYSNAHIWLRKGLEILNSLENIESFFALEFKVYKLLLLNDDNPIIEKIILNEVFPYLEQKKLEYQKYIYSNILADYYYKKRRYKSAAEYYKIAHKIISNIYNV